MDNASILSLVQNMRQEKSTKLENEQIFGEELFIKTRAGSTRVLLYKAKSLGKPAPIFFDVHGGGFVMGTPEHDDWFCNALRNELNITVISIDYRLAPEHKWPAGINDVYDVVNYVSNNSHEFNIDTKNMCIGGHSAGANISAVVCMLAKESKAFSFRCQILDYPPLDVATPPTKKFYTEGAIPPKIAEIFDSCYRLEEDSKNSHCSPVFASEAELKELPPAIVITCEIDSLRAEAEKYASMLIKAGVEVTARRFLGVPHGFTISMPDLKESKAAYRMIVDGLKKYTI